MSQRNRKRGRKGRGRPADGEQPQHDRPRESSGGTGAQDEDSQAAQDTSPQPAAEAPTRQAGPEQSRREQGQGSRRRNRRPRRRGGERREEGQAGDRDRGQTRSAAPRGERPSADAPPQGPPGSDVAAPDVDEDEEYVPRPPEPPPEMPLVTYLARGGIGSRRYCDELVGSGRVTVDGETVTFPRAVVPSGAEVMADGDLVRVRQLRYVLVNKPRGVASTRSDPHAASVVVDMVEGGRTLFPVGRLDVETTGLIVLTNDGPLAHRLMHPSYGVPKAYTVRVKGKVNRRAVAALKSGLELDDGMTAPAEARVLKQSGKTAVVELVIHEGRKRQVRRMFAALGLPVEELHRRRYGPLADKGLAVGATRELSAEEVDALQRAAEQVDSHIRSEPEERAVPLAGEQEAAAASLAEDGPVPAGEPPAPVAQTPAAEEPVKPDASKSEGQASANPDAIEPENQAPAGPAAGTTKDDPSPDEWPERPAPLPD